MKIFFLLLEPDEKIIEKIFYMPSTTGYMYQKAMAGSIRVIPGIVYKIGLAILQSGIENDIARLSEFKLDEKNLGECNPSGSETTCSFYNCFKDPSNKEITSYTGVISASLVYHKNPHYICDCDFNTWECSPKHGLTGHIANRAATRAAAKITLTPIRNTKGSNLMPVSNSRIRVVV